ncbi:MAG: iron-containing redox enzyme family protein [Cyanobacteria bacterium P01_G01_bin.54]
MPPIPPTSAPRITAHADTVLAQAQLLETPYFQALRNGEMTLEQFRRSQEQFYFAVTFFPRPLAALLAKLSNPSTRQGILHNLVEEHGDFNPEEFHEATIRRFVKNIGGNTDFNSLGICPAIHSFNSLLLGTCTLDEVEVGAACLGMIEYAFIGISATLAQQSIKRGWITPEKLSHYVLHEELDAKHAEDFFVLVESQWDNPLRRPLIKKGLELGIYTWKCFYNGLYEAALQAAPAAQTTATTELVEV